MGLGEGKMVKWAVGCYISAVIVLMGAMVAIRLGFTPDPGNTLILVFGCVVMSSIFWASLALEHSPKWWFSFGLTVLSATPIWVLLMYDTYS